MGVFLDLVHRLSHIHTASFQLNVDNWHTVDEQHHIATTFGTQWMFRLEPWLTDSLYLNEGFKPFFDKRAGIATDGLYPTVTARQIMWALKMKPIRRERWETVFDHKDI